MPTEIENRKKIETMKKRIRITDGRKKQRRIIYILARENQKKRRGRKEGKEEASMEKKKYEWESKARKNWRKLNRRKKKTVNSRQ